MHPFINIATKAARRAGNVITHGFERLDLIKTKSKGPRDFVTNIDQNAEKAIIETIQAAYPSHAFLAEESGKINKNEYTWIIDPVDGTTNLIHGFPYFAVSIALLHNNVIEHAVVYDPIKENLFTASRGDGAQKNNRRIRVSNQQNLENSLIATGFPFRSPKYHDLYHDTLKTLSNHCLGIRSNGSSALDLAYVASGQLDGSFELDLFSWDIAAGVLLVKEAGGLTIDFHGGENYLEKGHLIAANPKITKQLLKQLKPLTEKM